MAHSARLLSNALVRQLLSLRPPEPAAFMTLCNPATHQAKALSAGFARILHPLAPRWSGRNRVSASGLSALWRDWLYDEGSLTARLSALQPGTFNVQVVRQYYGQPTAVERQGLALGNNQTVWVREVVLNLGTVPLVYARTAVPVCSLTGKGARLKGLGNRSLGSFLFRQPGLKRTPLAVSHCAPNHLGLQWSRRSVFSLGRQSLMVTEAFSAHLNEFV